MRFRLRHWLALWASALIMTSAASGSTQTLEAIEDASNEPIEITATSLEYDSDLGIATFAGGVLVVQGTLRIRANSLVVNYDTSGNSMIDAHLGGDITTIEASGNVSIVSEETEATGDWAIYDLEADLVTLGGTVRLQSEGNILVGNKLTLDMTTGNTRLEAGTAPGGGRVRGVFKPTPDSDETPE